jgi:hypothetical protein
MLKGSGSFLAKKGLVTFVLASTLLGLTGCADNNERAANENRGNLGVNVRPNNVDNNTNVMDVRNGTNRDLRVSNRAGRNVEKLQGVDLAHVIIRGNDAYVAVKLENDNRNRRANMNNNGTNMGTTGITGTDRDTRANDLTARGAGTGRNGNYPSTTGITGTNNTDNALNPGTIDADNKGARTFGMGGNRYNAGIGTDRTTNDIGGTTGVRDTGMNGGTNGNNDADFRKASTRLEREIAKQVRNSERTVNNVYVSYDRDFFNRMTNYTTDIGNGRNRDGVLNDFSNTMNRTFR